MTTVTILGAGVMGSSMVLPFADRGHAVNLAGTHLDAAIVESVRSSGLHPRLGVKLPPVNALTHEAFSGAVAPGAGLILLGVSSAGVTWAIDRLCEALSAPVPVLMITKGLAPREGSIATLPDFVQAEVKRRAGLDLEIAAIGGPCIAGELAVRRNTGTVIVSRTPGLAEKLCGMIETGYYHPRASSDMVGVEVCAAFKNFFAIAVGWASGWLERTGKGENGAFNHNAAAVLFDQAVREMMVLARLLGGKEESVWGMPGAGDLHVTCQAGRNSRLGRHLGLGLSYAEVKAGPMKDDTIEGAELGLALADTLHALAASNALDRDGLPLTFALLETLKGGKPLDIPWNRLHRP